MTMLKALHSRERKNTLPCSKGLQRYLYAYESAAFHLLTKLCKRDVFSHLCHSYRPSLEAVPEQPRSPKCRSLVSHRREATEEKAEGIKFLPHRTRPLTYTA